MKTIVLAALASVLLVACGSDKIEGLVEIKDMKSGDHRPAPIKYTSNPPEGGPHVGEAVTNCGIYDVQIPLETTVHSLEHGAAWIAYQPDLAPKDVETLRALVRGKRYTLLAPYFYGGLSKPVVAVAWGFRLEVDKADDPRLAQFVKRFANGPQAPERGAACSGSFGRPIEAAPR